MEYRWLGRSGIRISRMGLGTGAFPEAGAPQHGVKLLLEAARLGVTFWDTANSYDTYREIRLALKALGPERARMIISSKLEAKSTRGASRQLQRCLHDLGRDWVDLMLLHYVREPLSHWAGAIEVLRKAKQRGDAVAIGLSTHNPRYVREAIETGLMDCVFVTLNVAGTWVEGRPSTRPSALLTSCRPRPEGTRPEGARHSVRGRTVPSGVEGRGGNAEMVSACQAAKRLGVGVVILKVLGSGELVTQKARALRWARGRSFADGLIVGVETIAQLEDDLHLLR